MIGDPKGTPNLCCKCVEFNQSSTITKYEYNKSTNTIKYSINQAFSLVTPNRGVKLVERPQELGGGV